ncbi:hypothetical protein GW17_00055408 [Ensete ventricosum]|nr:hypothetical protein GW17_00055408 [Ensete ventricosum]
MAAAVSVWVGAGNPLPKPLPRRTRTWRGHRRRSRTEFKPEERMKNGQQGNEGEKLILRFNTKEDMRSAGEAEQRTKKSQNHLATIDQPKAIDGKDENPTIQDPSDHGLPHKRNKKQEKENIDAKAGRKKSGDD